MARSIKFINDYQNEIHNVVSDISKALEIVDALNNPEVSYGGRGEYKKAMWRVDKEDTIKRLLDSEFHICNKIVYLNRLHKNEHQESFLNRYYEYGAVSRSATNDLEAIDLIVNFCKAMGYNIVESRSDLMVKVA